MNIAGVLVNAYPQQIDAVEQALLEFPGVEVHAKTDEGRVVVSVEGESEGGMADLFIKFQDIKGVLSAAMIYHHYEADPDAEVELDQHLEASL